MILACNVIRHKVDYHLHANLVGSCHQPLELANAILHPDGDVGIDIVIVGNGIGRASISLHDIRVAAGDATVLSLKRMPYHTCVPHMSDAHVANLVEHRRGDIVHLAAAVLALAAVNHTMVARVGKQAWKQLIDNRFLVIHWVKTFTKWEFLRIFIVSK